MDLDLERFLEWTPKELLDPLLPGVDGVVNVFDDVAISV
jgi:hypothetical protein